jgi:hypothetical protein
MLNPKKVIIIVILCIIGAVILVKGTNGFNRQNDIQTLNASATPSITKISYSCDKESTVLKSLEKNTDKVGLKEYSFGKMVESINNVSPSNGKYWLYSINGKEATNSADNYLCTGGEQIEWELK